MKNGASLPIFNQRLPVAIFLWRFHPYLLDQHPTPFCYNMNYRIR